MTVKLSLVRVMFLFSAAQILLAFAVMNFDLPNILDIAADGLGAVLFILLIWYALRVKTVE